MFSNINGFQKRIVVPVMISCAATCLMTLLCLTFLIARISNTNTLYNFNINNLEVFIPWFLIVIALILLCIIYWIYQVSDKLFGPYQRIVKELDDVLAGERKKPLGTRKGDEFFTELLERINRLIE